MRARSLAARAFGLLAATFLPACGETTVEVQLHALQASGEAAFVCRTPGGEGIDRSQCPDYELLGYRIFALVTQTSTEEVAVIDTRAAEVVDIDPSVPGYSFLRVPSRPGDIASSPGGAATFVGLTGVGKTGITAIPTTCIGPPVGDESTRDVTSFASCHLPTTPGDIAVLVAPPGPDGTIPESCESGSPAEDTNPSGARVSECQANLTVEHLDADGNVVGPIGRRKLAVALPDFGEIAIIDAQWLVDQAPGSFPECRIEATLALGVDLGPAGTTQVLDDAPELTPPAGCVVQQPRTPPEPPSQARPGGFAVADDLLYVADRAAPLIHALDVSNPCAPNELPPLLPMSFERPNRVVTTSRVAASPLTPDGKRYLYAIDELDQPAASVMAFDVSPGSTNRTPLVRPGSLYVPEPPDRLRLSTPIADVAFAFRDLPASDPDTGVAETGVRCDPDPRIDRNSAAAQHRPTSDRSRGAQPRLLRGLFGLAMLTSGHVAIIDVDDFDAPCRRPYTTNPEPEEDFRGCSGDSGLPPYLTLGDDMTAPGTDPRGAVTVSNEVSCHVVEPHRFRSAVFAITNSTLGTGAPGLTAFPEFSRPVSVDRPPQHAPKLLAVPFEPTVDGGTPPPAELYIGTTLHTKGRAGADLPSDPNTSLLASLTLPFVEPRTLPPSDNVSLVFEGAITRDFPSGSIVIEPAGTDPDDTGMRIEDPTAEFCDTGVYDLEMLREYDEEKLRPGASTEAHDLFARTHADIVEVTSDFLPLEDPYWNSERLLGGECGITRSVCVETFGDFDPPEVSLNRELAVSIAYQDRLVVEAANAETDDERAELQTRFECCFPQGIQYRVRVRKQWVLAGSQSGLRHDVTAKREGSLFRCERDCDPQKQFWNGRVFEIASRQGVDCSQVEGPATCAVGVEEPGDPCVYDPCLPDGDPAGPTPTSCRRLDGSLRLVADDIGPADEDAVSCIHSGLTSRFAVYRGLSPSTRGMTFTWQTTGGFRALLTSIASVSIAVLPQNVQYIPEIQRIAIVDGASLGLSLVSIDSLRVEQPWPVY